MGGTNNAENWMSNIDLIQTKYEHIPANVTLDDSAWDAMIHQGFYDNWQDLEQLGMNAAIKAMLTKYDNSDILVTGHSLGGALAAIAALELLSNPEYTSYAKKSVNIISFGQPRWCNKNLALYFNDIIDSNWRIVNEHDSVPTIPYESMGYYHTSTEVWYTSTDPLTYHQCDGSGEDWGCYYVGYSVDDHLNYFGLYEDCPDTTSVNKSTEAPLFSSTMDECDCDDGDDSVFKTTDMDSSFIDDAVDKVNDASKEMIIIVLGTSSAIGWLMACLCGLCCCRMRYKFNKQMKK